MQTAKLTSVALVFLFGATLALAQDKKHDKADKHERAEVNKPAPAFEMKDLDGKTIKLADLKDKTVVLEWMSEDCPASRFAMPTMRELAEKYSKEGVVWLGIDSTSYETAEKAKKYVEENKIPYSILLDPDGDTGRLYGAKTTPHMFIIHKGTLVYSGALDNGGMRSKGDRNYVSEVLDAVLAGKDAPIQTTTPYGCRVKYAKKKKDD